MTLKIQYAAASHQLVKCARGAFKIISRKTEGPIWTRKGAAADEK